MVVIHLIRHLDNPKTVCEKDTVKVANLGERLTLKKKDVTCVDCLKNI